MSNVKDPQKDVLVVVNVVLTLYAMIIRIAQTKNNSMTVNVNRASKETAEFARKVSIVWSVFGCCHRTSWDTVKNCFSGDKSSFKC